MWCVVYYCVVWINESFKYIIILYKLMEKSDLKPSYRKNIYFAEDELPMLKTFEIEIDKEKQFNSLGKGKKKFSAVIKLFMKSYLEEKESENA